MPLKGPRLVVVSDDVADTMVDLLHFGIIIDIGNKGWTTTMNYIQTHEIPRYRE